MSSVRSSGAVFLLGVLLAAPFLMAQSDTATMVGFVRDPTGAVVPNAGVVVRNEATGVERKAQTNASGYYTVTNLPPATYMVTVEAQGFKKVELRNNKLDPNTTATVDVSLTVGQVTETVEVVAEAVQIQSDTATVGKVIESSQIRHMQLNGRNPLYLAQLKPGVRGGTLAGFSFGLTTAGLNINGARTQDNIITFDGAPAVRTRSNGTSIGVADVDSVQEIQILTANYNAEYGRAAGGQIRIVTKSGSRDFHGDFYEYLRNSAMNANGWQRNQSRTAAAFAPAPFRYNQFGYHISGPVYIPGVWNTEKNKAFFLWSQEWVRFRRESSNTRTVPTPAMRNGDFSELLNASNPFFGRVRAVNDPNTGQPFSGNIIPASRLSPNGIGFLRSAPLPTPGFQQGTNNHFAVAANPTDQRKDTVSIDYNWNDKHSTRFRHQNYSYYDLNPFDRGSDRTPREFERPNRTASLNHIWTISPTLVNETLVTASVDRVYIRVVRTERLNRANYGINYPYIFPDRKEISEKIPTVDVPSFYVSDGGPYPAQSTGPIYNVSNNTTKIMGAHTIKWGALWERSGQNDFDQINVSGVPGGTNNQNGRFVFSDARTGAPTTGVGIANAAMGLFDTYAEIGVRSFTPYRGHMFEWFLQDSWKATNKLRIELGLRHTFIQPYYSLWRNMVVFDPKYYDPAKAVRQDPRTGNIVVGSGDQYNGIVIPGDGWPDAAKGRVPIADTGEFNRLFRGEPKQFSDVHKLLFQPRVGIAYSLTPKSVVRAGIGRFVTRLGVSDSIFLGGNPPLQPMVSISHGTADNPGGGGPGTAFPLNVTTQDKIFPNPESWAWNVTFQRELPANTTIEVGYVGRRGLHGQRERNMNQLQPGTVQANRGVNVDSLRPFRGFGPIRITNNDANMRYNSFQLDLTRRFSRGLSFNIAYTYSRCYDDGSAQRDIIPNAFDASNLWGPCTYDNPNILVAGWIWELPIFKDRGSMTGKLLGGWHLASAIQFQQGGPATVATGDDFAGVGTGSGSQIWNINGDWRNDDPQFAAGGSRDPAQYIRVRNPDGSAIFTAPAAGTFTAQRNRGVLRQPGFQNWNISVSKAFYLAESHYVTFRAEAFNFPNHPNWNGFDTNPRSGTFGKVTGKGSERQLQLSLRYTF